MTPTDSLDPARTVAQAAAGSTSLSDATVPRSFGPDADADPDLPSTSIPGYQLLGILGRGGMGVVYKAQNLALKRTVALKMILAGSQAGPRELARFRIEAEAVARLQHPNIVQIHEVGETGGHPYFALEYVEGGNLATKLAGSPLPAAEAATCVGALARAMQLAHSRNVIHRDLKPANILLASDGTPKITDFGLARQTDSDSGETQAGAVMGTPSYMAPEQAAGFAHEAGPAADVYALGAILYTCLTGRPPFKGATVVETLDQVRNQEPVPPSRGVANVPRDLETICLKCLQKQPEKRYASAGELADELDRYRRGEPILARPVGSVERATKWIRRHPVGTALIATVVLLVLSIPSYALVFADAMASKNRDLEKKNTDLIQKEAEKSEALKQARVSEARRALTFGLNLCDQGDVSRGLVALTQALAAAVLAEDSDLESAIRYNLAAWERQAWRLRAIMPAPLGIPVIAAALSPDGKVVAVAMKNQTVQLWDAAEGREGRLLHILPHTGDTADKYCSVQFSADGRLLLTRTDRAVHLWNVDVGKPACPPLRFESPVSAVALDPSGAWILTGEEKGLARLWATSTGRQIGDAYDHKKLVSAAAFSADGRRALSASNDGKVQLWDIPSGRAEGPSYNLKGWVTMAHFSRDGKRLLVSTRSFTSGMVHLLNTETGAALTPPLASESPVEEVQFGPDETSVILRTRLGPTIATVRIWNIGSGLPSSLLTHPSDVHCFALTPDGKTLLTAGKGGSARFWDSTRGIANGQSLYHDGQVVEAVAFSRDGRTLMTWDGDIRLWEAPRGFRRAVLPHTGTVNTITFNADGKLALTACADGTARLWHTANGELVSKPWRHEGEVRVAAFTPDGRTALTGGVDTHLRLWDTATGELRAKIEGHRQMIVALAVSPDGTCALTGSNDGTARLWDLSKGRPLGDAFPHAGPVQAVAFSPDGRTVATASDDRSVRLWSVETLLPSVPALIHECGVESVAFAADGKTVYSAGHNSALVHCWDAATGEAQLSLAWHTEGVWAIAASPNNRIVLSAGADRAARFWNQETRVPQGLPLQHQDIVRDLAFGPDGDSVLTGSYDTTARRWHATSGIPIGPAFQHKGKLRSVALSPDRRTAGTASFDGTAILWEAPPALEGSPDQIARWAQVVTGIDLEDSGAIRALSATSRQQRIGDKGLPGSTFNK